MPALKVNNKKQAIAELAAKASVLTGQSERDILEILLQREKLGSTGVGNGVAFRTANCPNSENCFGLFARLDRAIDFESLDNQPVDLVFLLLAPKERVPTISRRWRASRDCCAIRSRKQAA